MKKSKHGAYTRLEFNSYRDIMDYLKDNKWDYANSKITRSKSFCSHTWSETLDYLEKGWSEGTTKLTGIADKLKSTMDESAAYNIQYDVTGDYIDMGRYMTGEPETFGNVIQETVPMETLSLSVDVCFSAYVSERTIYNRGAAITTLIDELQKQYFVNLRIVFQLGANSMFYRKNKADKEPLQVIFNIDMQNEYSRDLMAFYLANTAFFRRIGFAIMETYFDKPDLNGYGHCEPFKSDKDEIHLGVTSHEMDKFQSEESSIKEVKRMLEKYKQ